MCWLLGSPCRQTQVGERHSISPGHEDVALGWFCSPGSHGQTLSEDEKDGTGFISGELRLQMQPDGTGLESFNAAPLPRTCLNQLG